jgi:hypothetical protein
MQELKPVARINEWHHCNVYFDEEGYPSAYEVIPDTHRIVPVSLLHAIEIDMAMECTNFNTLNQLRAIIGDPT